MSFAGCAVMQDLYSDKDYADISSQLKKRYLCLGILCAFFLALFILAMVTRTEWLAIASLILFFVSMVFVIDLFCLPLSRYRKLIAAALAGRTHTETLEFSKLEEEISVVDGVRCRGMIFLGAPDKHGSREQRFYWDAERPLPAFQPGQQVTLKYTGRNIIGYET